MHLFQRALRLSLALSAILLLAACTVAPTEMPSATSAAAPAPTTAPKAAQQTVIVFAAASLTESFGELGKLFESTHPGVKILFNFASSQQLSAQLLQGANADVFASANTKEMDNAIKGGVIISGTQRTFARNRLIVIFPVGNPGKLAALADLARPGLKLDVADKAVPVGQYTQDMLDKMSKDAAYGPDFKTNVLKNVVSYENDVKAVVSKVSLGEADGEVVYATDVTAAVAPKLATLGVPDQFNQIAIYPIAPLASAPQPELAKQFVDLVLSDAGQQVLARYGFIRGNA